MYLDLTVVYLGLTVVYLDLIVVYLGLTGIPRSNCGIPRFGLMLLRSKLFYCLRLPIQYNARGGDLNAMPDHH